MNFFVPKLVSQELSVLDSAHLWSMRVGVGDCFDCTDLCGNPAKLTVLSIDKKSKRIKIKIDNLCKVIDSSAGVLFQAIPDKVYLDKLMEVLPLMGGNLASLEGDSNSGSNFVGVGKCFLFFADRSVKYSLNLDRLDKILIRSCEQSQKAYKPQLIFVESQSELQELINKHQPVVLDCQTIKNTDSKDMQNSTKIKSVLVGPEGGWSKQELEDFRAVELDFESLGSVVYPSWLAGFRYFL
jgi:16S rRNA U1498 N3-methylase RsmE